MDGSNLFERDSKKVRGFFLFLKFLLSFHGVMLVPYFLYAAIPSTFGHLGQFFLHSYPSICVFIAMFCGVPTIYFFHRFFVLGLSRVGMIFALMNVFCFFCMAWFSTVSFWFSFVMVLPTYIAQRYMLFEWTKTIRELENPSIALFEKEPEKTDEKVSSKLNLSV